MKARGILSDLLGGEERGRAQVVCSLPIGGERRIRCQRVSLTLILCAHDSTGAGSTITMRVRRRPL